ncbi:phage tail assembly protein [Ectothiorhodospira mobilis]|uniref:phage tail assembly protein n=1 Tax=Ectothiorhodospira mobilis TaxID=195064 RepID=UPI00190838C0|nr:phage tail assembly protein [Ectothiorhodospira mobilis]MBK1690970.1 hypothetical protein [Ectothiorhodospira mobilis]
MEEIKLEHPITADGQEVQSLKLRRPKVRDLEVMEAAGDRDIARSVSLIANLAEVSPDALRELDAGDFMRVSETVAGFLGQKSLT